MILKIDKYSFRVLEINKELHTIIVSPEDHHSVIVVEEWIRLIIKNEFPKYYNNEKPYPHLPLTKEACNELVKYHNRSHGPIGVLWNNLESELVKHITPVDFRVNDPENIDITFMYKEIK